MKRILFILATTVMVIAMLVSSGCTAGKTTETNKEPIKIGYVTNYSNVVQRETMSAAQLAVDEINAAGGIKGRTVEIINVDEGGQLPRAVEAYRRLVMTDRCPFVILAEGTDLSLAQEETGKDLYKEYPHIAISTGSADYRVTQKISDNYSTYKFFFRMCLNSIDSAIVFAVQESSAIMKQQGLTKIAWIVEDANYTTVHREGGVGLPSMPDQWKAKGIDVVYQTKVDTTEKMFLPIFEKIAASGAQYIHFTGSYVDVTTLIKQWATSAAKDIPIDTFGAGASPLAGFWGSTSGACLGTMVNGPEGSYPITDKTAQFTKDLHDKYGVGSTWMSPSTYDTVSIIKAAIEKVGNTSDVESLIKAMETIELPVGIYGKVAFSTEQGFRMHTSKIGYPYYSVFIGQWQGEGNVVVIYPDDLAKKFNPGKGYVSPKDLRAKK